MGVVCLESLWKEKLLNKGWPKYCVDKYPSFLAFSTLAQYNTCLKKKFWEFYTSNEYTFPPNDYDLLPIIVTFLNDEAEKSDRPESMLKSMTSALKHWATANDLCIDQKLLDNFVKALIRVNTIKPKGRTKILPIQAFLEMFRKLGHNEGLKMCKLRQKTITLLAFAAMCRPSDIAPSVGFKRRQINFVKEGMVIKFFGTKTDASRTGYEILIKRASETIIDPVQCMEDYLARTKSLVTDQDEGPVFISLKSPFTALSASGVADTLNKCIVEAGLKQTGGFSARCFRPTHATAYVSSGVEHHITR